MKAFLSALTLCLLFTASDISILKIKIGSPEADLKKIKLEELSREDGMVKYRTENGNDFSVTVEKGKVVYMENDWMHDQKASKTLLPWFKFGTTTLKDIRKKFGTNGFTHRNVAQLETETGLALFNCFEFDSANNEILVTITKVPNDDTLTEDNLAENAKLEALIIADKKYLESIWGDEKAFDKNYKKIKL